MQTYQDELISLIELVQFKGYKRNGCVLYAKYGYFKPECTISELVWGFCRNPCFARQLVRDLSVHILDYTDILSKSNSNITTIYSSLDAAMAKICKKTAPRVQIAYSSQGTNPADSLTIQNGQLSLQNGQFVQVHNATDEDGEMWHGLTVGQSWELFVSNVKVSIFNSDESSLLWQYRYGKKSVIKRVRDVNGARVFQPFKHSLPLLGLDIKVVTTVTFVVGCPSVDSKQIFSILSKEFSNWMSDASLELKLCKNTVAQVSMQDHTINFKIVPK